ncbi:hypothetical protein [Streptomyces turgidiscabies]|uniref:Uncharacterized protein n=1 Tax=Streptomyces turgidiscabies TaxID=85558 RepID=A0ABU0RYD6_9ACTN|nr:hypothetical protein [Streptomyces turgidiscabies]MDQ0936998.1 hypothetical protein [Streptomyces turgidiscabies]
MSTFRHPGLAEPRNKEEWRRYRGSRAPEQPVMPPYEEYLKLSDDHKDDLNEDRDNYHSALAIIDTSQVKRLHYLMERRMKANARRAAGAQSRPCLRRSSHCRQVHPRQVVCRAL